MVSGAPRALTRIGFRRHVKLFLTILVGYLIVIIVILLLLLRNFVEHTRTVVTGTRTTIANLVAADVATLTNDHAIAAQLPALQARFAIDGATFIRADGETSTTGVPPTADGVETVERPVAGGRLVLVFDASQIAAMEQFFWRTAGISVAAAFVGWIFLTLYLPRITGPIEEMLGSAAALGERAPNVDEQEYLIATFRDSITTLKRQELELQDLYELQKTRADDLERVTSTLTRSMTSGFLALDPTGRVVDVNASARAILGEPRLAPGEATLFELFGENSVTRAVMRSLTDRLPLTRAEVMTGDSAPEQIIGLTTVPLVGENEPFLGMVALFTDLTSIRELETRVRDMQTFADLGEISAGIAHEFRNSLATILGYLRLTQRDELPPDAARRVQQVETEARALAEAVDALVNFARRLTVDVQRLDLRALAEDVARRVGAADENVRITVAGEAVEVDGDRVLLARALENVLRNALDAVRQTGTAGAVRLTVTRRDTTAVLSVADTGVGINAEDVHRAFLPFHSTKSSGLGLGLPLAKKIVLVHGGNLRLAPQPEGGAVATIELPLRTNCYKK